MFLNHLKEQSYILTQSIFRETQGHYDLQVDNIISYTYPTSWSLTHNKAYNYIKDIYNPAILNIYSTQPLHAIYNEENSYEEREIILYPIELIVVARYSVEIGKQCVTILDVIPEHKIISI